MLNTNTSQFQMSFASLRKIRSLTNYLKQGSFKTCISFGIDDDDFCLKSLCPRLAGLRPIGYGNNVLMGLPKLQTQKIQSIRNMTASLISGTIKFDHITPVLKDLHWLKIEERIQYKRILQVHKCLKIESPSYLSSKLSTA